MTAATRWRTIVTERLPDVAQRAALALFRWDERIVNRFDPPRPGPVPPGRYPWARQLEANWEVMRAELDALLEAGVEFPDTDRLAAADLGTDGRWTSYILWWFGERLTANAARCPRTAELLGQVPGVQIAGYTVLHPHSSVPLHQGPSKSLRYHLALRVPDPAGCCRLQIDDEVVEWSEGASAAFDDRSHHAVWNDGDEPRYVLFVQVAWPIAGPVRVLHSLVGRLFGVLAGGMPRRAVALDRELNSGVVTPAVGSAGPPAAAPTEPTEPVLAADAISRPTFRDRTLETSMERFGYVVAPPIDADLLEAARRLHAELGPAPDDPGRTINWSFHSRSDEYKRTAHDRLLELFRPYLADLLDDHVPYLATFITKWPGDSSAFAPHQDPTLVDERFFRGVTIWIPLEDTLAAGGVDNGMLHVVPGSHRFSRSLRVQDVDQFEFAAVEDLIVDEVGRGVPTSAGDVLVFDNRVIHYSWPNESAEPRVVVSFTVRPSETTPVLLRSSSPGTVDLYRIHDDFYLDVLPADQHLWDPGRPADAVLPAPNVAFDASGFLEFCTSVDPAPGTVDAVVRRRVAWRDPDPACHLCSSTIGLDETSRAGRNNAQLVCARCRSELEAAQGSTGDGPSSPDSGSHHAARS